MVKDLFPNEARFCYVRTQSEYANLFNYELLSAEEQSLVAKAVDSRKAEFGDARWCAHQALQDLGAYGDGPILRGERGMPLWPEGFTGSMTHTEGLRAAVVAPTTAVRAMGLDAEPAGPLPENVLNMIARAGELAQLEKLREAGVTCPDRLLFCAKEATYKAWFPMTRRWLDFDQAEIDLREDGTLISYILARPTPVPFICGNWAIKDGFVMVSTVVPPLR
ncbi:Phosphopantetheinyl transferase component of siderophore synthetase [Corynebacterium camporealensis]|uniref:Phosphopantetheinyl transferase component of siderophore synthetase n=1 Tax=Corynebacterium camporealensis TaxID=161896 RepID=A0A0F6QWG6_9CORY|nr:4'-phosphopantetheinyl transferase superfamily protein [Corynebacterium camporealensis]AKE39387.1 phosphopantetheinyl transferase component of siderophore synthetase [Corynebacterium camporealensis]AVH88557.1 Phosphopantetheinyl transferase component of siderophore synthetase [Corynebacterium camporealensis]MDY5840281.1 4'-phosphopantetheinyl transferase superfamily protein [Corynebacterium camporealensis]